MNEMVDRVARALATKNELIWDRMDEDATTIEEGRPYWRGQARVAIAAMREPTQAMVDAGQRTECGHGEGNCGCAVSWSAMIDAALEL